MKPRLIVAVVALLLGIGGGAWWWSSRTPTEPESTDAPSELSRDEILRQKQQARLRGQFDRTPCSARGRVTRKEDGSGVQGAVVLLKPAGFYGSETRDAIAVHTGTHGEWSARDIVPGRYNVSATVPGHLPAHLAVVPLSAGKDHADLDLAVSPGGSVLDGVITDIDGNPIAGARVEATPMTGSTLSAPVFYGSLTADDGTFSLGLFPNHYAVSIAHADYVRYNARVALKAQRRHRQFKLVPGGRVEGTVVSRTDGKPVPNAEVRMIDPKSTMGSYSQGYIPAKTDAAGRFSLTGLPPGDASLEAVAEGYGSLQPTVVPMGTGETVRDVEVIVDRGYTVSGFVVVKGDEVTGVPGVMVFAMAFSRFPPATYISPATEDDGHFVFHGVRPGNYIVMVVGDEIVPDYMSVSFEIRDQDNTDLLVPVDRGHRVRGKVSPAQQAQISAAVDVDFQNINPLKMPQIIRAMTSTVRSTRADHQGAFDYGPIPDGDYTLRVVGEQGGTAERRIEIDGSDIEGLALALEPGLTLTGVVVGDNRQPVSGISIALHRKQKDQRPTFDISALMGSGAQESLTDDAGAFTMEGVEPGEYIVSVRDDNLLRMPWANPADPEHPYRPASLSVNRDTSNTPIELVVTGIDASLSGVVRDQAGKPAPNVWVRAWPELDTEQWSEVFDTGSMPNTSAPSSKTDASNTAAFWMNDAGRALGPPPVRTDAQGRFGIRDLRTLPHSVVAEDSHGARRTMLRGVAPGKDVSIELAPLGRLNLVLGGEAPSSPYRIEVRGQEVRTLLVRAQQNEPTVDRLLPGIYEVTVTADGGYADGSITVEAGQDAQLDMELGGWASLSGTLVSRETGKPIAGVSYMLLTDAADFGQIMAMAQAMFGMSGATKDMTDERGRFQIDRLHAGRVRVGFLTFGGWQMRGGFEVYVGPGEAKDMGELAGLDAPHVPADKRGWLGMKLSTATEGVHARAVKEAAETGAGTGGEVAVAEYTINVGPGGGGMTYETTESKSEADEPPDTGPTMLWVHSVIPGGPAEAAGIAPGDRVLEVDGEPLGRLTPSTAKALLGTGGYLEIGETRGLTLDRNGERRSVTLEAVKPPKKGG